jgi:hypothetical protein
MQVEVLINLREISFTKTSHGRCSVARKAENFTWGNGEGGGGDIPIYRDIFLPLHDLRSNISSING